MSRLLRALTLVLVVWLVSPSVAATGVAVPALSGSPVYAVVADTLVPHVAGRASALSATLWQDGAPVAHQPFTLLVTTAGATRAAGQAVTDANGGLDVTTVLDRNATAQWQSSTDPTVVSNPYPVEVAPAVTRRANDRTLRRGQRFVIRGRTFPAKAGCRVELWRGELRPLVLGPRPVRLARSTVRRDGTYRLVRRFHRPGRMRVAVVVRPCADNGRGLSAYVPIRVR